MFIHGVQFFENMAVYVYIHVYSFSRHVVCKLKGMGWLNYETKLSQTEKQNEKSHSGA